MNSKAQFTSPFPTTNASWTELTTLMKWNFSEWNHTRTITIGDTIINGYTYYFAAQTDNIIDTSMKFPMYGIDSMKVYFRIDDTTERLQFDFGLDIGDSMLLDDGITYGILTQIDTATIFSGQQVTRFIMQNAGIWYYGIGSEYGLSNMDYCECAMYLTSFSVDGDCYIFYSGYDSTLCYSANLLEVGENDFFDDDLSIFPNPSNGKFSIESASFQNSIYEISDLNGKIISSSKINSAATEIELNIPNGIYFIKIENENGLTVQKLIIQK